MSFVPGKPSKDTHYHPDSQGQGAIEHEDRSAGHRGREYRQHVHAGEDGRPATNPTGNPSTKILPYPAYLDPSRPARAPLIVPRTDPFRRRS